MKRRPIIVASVALLLMSSVAFGQDKRRTEKFSVPLGQTGDLVGSCGTFDILNDWTSVYTGILVYDKAGQFVQQVDHTRLLGDSRYYNSADPAKEVLGGYWMINVKSRDEAIAWAKKVPAQDGDVIEVRQVFEMEEFPEDVQRAGESAIVREQLKKHAKV